MSAKRFCLVPLVLLAVPFTGLAPRSNADDIADYYKKRVNSCVFIVSPEKRGYSMGSGSLIDAEKRLVLTNFHVVTDHAFVYVQFPVMLKDGEMLTNKQKYIDRITTNQAIKAEVLFVDKGRDLAVIKLKTKPPEGTLAIPLAKSSTEVGKAVWNIGSPGAVDDVFGMSEGRVRAVALQKFVVSAGDFDFEINAKMVTTSVPSNPGDSGGPLLDSKGEMVGVTQSGRRGANAISNFVDISEVRALLKQKNLIIDEGAAGDSTVPKKVPTVIDVGPGVKPRDPGTTLTPGKVPVPAVDKEMEKTALAALNRAKTFYGKEEEDRPKFAAKLKDILSKYPQTTAAKEAKTILDGLKGF